MSTTTDDSFDRALDQDALEEASSTHRHYFKIHNGIFICACTATADRHGRVREAA